MGMRTIKLATVLIIAVAGISIRSGYADTPLSGPQPKDAVAKKSGTKQQELYNDLGLTDQQRKLLDENRNRHREQAKALFTQMRQKMALLRQELEKNELNMQAVYQANNELKQLQAQMLDGRLERVLEVRKILTPEQFKKIEYKMNGRMERFKNRRERNREKA